MSGGEVAGILVAVFWAILVSFLAVALARLAQTLKATTKLVADVTDQAVPLLADASTFGGPLVKVAAFGYGVRRAIGGRREGEAPGDQRRTVIVGRTVPGTRRSKRSTRGKKD